LFLGRIAPVKNIETLLMSAKSLPKVNFSIVGSSEKNYVERLKRIIANNKITNVSVSPPVYDLRKKAIQKSLKIYTFLRVEECYRVTRIQPE